MNRKYECEFCNVTPSESQPDIKLFLWPLNSETPYLACTKCYARRELEKDRLK